MMHSVWTDYSGCLVLGCIQFRVGCNAERCHLGLPEATQKEGEELRIRFVATELFFTDNQSSRLRFADCHGEQRRPVMPDAGAGGNAGHKYFSGGLSRVFGRNRTRQFCQNRNVRFIRCKGSITWQSRTAKHGGLLASSLTFNIA